MRRATSPASIEDTIGYKSVSWVEASEDILSVLIIRNIIMYSVVSAILVVASFGIYNTLSTIVMEKTRDIAIMKSMGFHARDVRSIFLLEGLIVGAVGSVFGLALGVGLMKILVRGFAEAAGRDGSRSICRCGGARSNTRSPLRSRSPRASRRPICRRGAPVACTRSTSCGG